MIETKIVKMSPRVAADLLHRNHPNNRPISRSVVQKYARQMTEGRWLLDGNAIKLSNGASPKLLDGQHRCEAVLLSGKTVEMLMVEGLDEAAFVVMDQGKGRAASDYLESSKARDLAAAARIAYAKERYGLNSGQKMSNRDMPENSELLEFIEKHPELTRASETVPSWTENKRLMTGSLAIYFWTVFSDIHYEDALKFFVDLGEGINFDLGDPCRHLRERLIADKGSHTRLNKQGKAALIIKAWNYRREKKKIKTLAWKSTSETFPEPQ